MIILFQFVDWYCVLHPKYRSLKLFLHVYLSFLVQGSRIQLDTRFIVQGSRIQLDTSFIVQGSRIQLDTTFTVQGSRIQLDSNF